MAELTPHFEHFPCLNIFLLMYVHVIPSLEYGERFIVIILWFRLRSCRQWYFYTLPLHYQVQESSII